MAATLTTLDLLTKNRYVDGLPDYVNKNHPLLDRLTKITDRKRFSGRKFILGAKEANSQSVGGVGEGETLPTPSNVSLLNMEIALKYHYSVAKLSRQAMEYATGDEGAFADSVTTELDSARDQLMEELAKHLSYGTGYGELGQVSAYSGTTLTMIGSATNGGIGTRMLNKNGYYQSYTALTGGSQGANHKQVTNITSATVATAEASAGFVANDYVFRSITASVDPRAKVTAGLGAIVDDGSRVATFQTASRTTYPSLKANKLGNSGTLRAWTPELSASLCSESSQNGGGGYPTALWSNVKIQERAASYLWTDRRAKMDDMNIEGGYSGVFWNAPGAGKLPWFQDRFYRPHELHAIKESDLFLVVGKQFGVRELNNDGGMWRYTDRTDQVEAWMNMDLNLGARQCNNTSYLADISYDL